MKRILTFCVIQFLFAAVSFAVDADSLKVVADSAYAREDFELAARTYQKIAKTGESAAVCYNLGNCYYRLDDIAHAILWYERASLLSPGDEDIRFNLDMARSKTIDRVTPRHEFFFVTWFRSMTNWMSADAWARLSVVLFVLGLIALAVYIYAHQMWLRKSGFTLAVVLVLATLLGNVCAWSQRNRQTSRKGAVVMAASVVVKSTPSRSGSDLFVMHEGTRVEIRDNSLNEWAEVVLADGKQGWVEKKQIEVI
ncbi:MAG: tetratricopeptide repeat protein [Bacteroidaceae bacterium]|nr:tetratricopeptide repeat protein [Bacteroidaceae bacterium]